MISLACAIISSSQRWGLVRDQILPQVLKESFDEVVVAGDGASGEGYRFLHIPSITGTTIDALIKRDAAALASTAEYLVYLSDDHRVVPGFVRALRDYLTNHAAAVIIPARVTWREENGGYKRYDLNSGAGDGYCGGHAGIFSRDVLQLYPWACAPHDLLWDLTHSRHLQSLGVQFHYAPEVMVEDIEHLLNPAAIPWR